MAEDLAPVRPAATLILLRDGDAGLETLLVRRHGDLVFHGGSWVFPGGRLDPGDYVDGVQPADLTHVAHEDAARAGAVREAFEETGVVVDTSSLVPFSHWTTPPGRPRRFSTWFFVAPAPSASVVTDGAEITDHRWLTPAGALAAKSAGTVELPPPTFVSLSRLARSTTVADALAEARAAPYLRFEPESHRVEGGAVFVYPGDVAYGGGGRLDGAGGRHRLWALDSGWRYECDGSADGAPSAP